MISSILFNFFGRVTLISLITTLLVSSLIYQFLGLDNTLGFLSGAILGLIVLLLGTIIISLFLNSISVKNLKYLNLKIILISGCLVILLNLFGVIYLEAIYKVVEFSGLLFLLLGFSLIAFVSLLHSSLLSVRYFSAETELLLTGEKINKFTGGLLDIERNALSYVSLVSSFLFLSLLNIIIISSKLLLDLKNPVFINAFFVIVLWYEFRNLIFRNHIFSYEIQNKIPRIVNSLSRSLKLLSVLKYFLESGLVVYCGTLLFIFFSLSKNLFTFSLSFLINGGLLLCIFLVTKIIYEYILFFKFTSFKKKLNSLLKFANPLSALDKNLNSSSNIQSLLLSICLVTSGALVYTFVNSDETPLAILILIIFYSFFIREPLKSLSMKYDINFLRTINNLVEIRRIRDEQLTLFLFILLFVFTALKLARVSY